MAFWLNYLVATTETLNQGEGSHWGFKSATD